MSHFITQIFTPSNAWIGNRSIIVDSLNIACEEGEFVSIDGLTVQVKEKRQIGAGYFEILYQPA